MKQALRILFAVLALAVLGGIVSRADDTDRTLDSVRSEYDDVQRSLDKAVAGTNLGELRARVAKREHTLVLAPVLVRADAFLEANLDLVTDGLDGIFVLGGDQDVAMEVVNNTPFEAALARVQADGAVTSGNSAGAAVESADMIAGFTGANGPEQGLEADSVDVWHYSGPTDTERGLVFGLQNVLRLLVLSHENIFRGGRH